MHFSPPLMLDIPGSHTEHPWLPFYTNLIWKFLSSLLTMHSLALSPLPDTGWSGAEGEGSWYRDKRETEFPHWSRRGCQELEGTLMKNLEGFLTSQLASLKMMEHIKTLCEINQHSQDLRSLRSSDSSHAISMVWGKTDEMMISTYPFFAALILHKNPMRSSLSPNKVQACLHFNSIVRYTVKRVKDYNRVIVHVWCRKCPVCKYNIVWCNICYTDNVYKNKTLTISFLFCYPASRCQNHCWPFLWDWSKKSLLWGKLWTFMYMNLINYILCISR